MSSKYGSKPQIAEKVAVLGDTAVGKSCLVLRLNKPFSEIQNTDPTIGAAFVRSEIELENVVVTLELWDTAGQERYRSLAPMYYRGSRANVVVFDVTSRASLNGATRWVTELMRYGEPGALMVLVANKVDLCKEKEHEEILGDAVKYAQENGLVFFKTSVKTGEGVKEVFQCVAEELAKGKKTNDVSSSEVKKSIPKPVKAKRTCCGGRQPAEKAEDLGGLRADLLLDLPGVRWKKVQNGAEGATVWDSRSLWSSAGPYRSRDRAALRVFDSSDGGQLEMIMCNGSVCCAGLVFGLMTLVAPALFWLQSLALWVGSCAEAKVGRKGGRSGLAGGMQVEDELGTSTISPLQVDAVRVRVEEKPEEEVVVPMRSGQSGGCRDVFLWCASRIVPPHAFLLAHDALSVATRKWVDGDERLPTARVRMEQDRTWLRLALLLFFSAVWVAIWNSAWDGRSVIEDGDGLHKSIRVLEDSGALSVQATSSMAVFAIVALSVLVGTFVATPTQHDLLEKTWASALDEDGGMFFLRSSNTSLFGSAKALEADWPAVLVTAGNRSGAGASTPPAVIAKGDGAKEMQGARMPLRRVWSALEEVVEAHLFQQQSSLSLFWCVSCRETKDTRMSFRVVRRSSSIVSTAFRGLQSSQGFLMVAGVLCLVFPLVSPFLVSLILETTAFEDLKLAPPSLSAAAFGARFSAGLVTFLYIVAFSAAVMGPLERGKMLHTLVTAIISAADAPKYALPFVPLWSSPDAPLAWAVLRQAAERTVRSSLARSSVLLVVTAIVELGAIAALASFIVFRQTQDSQVAVAASTAQLDALILGSGLLLCPILVFGRAILEGGVSFQSLQERQTRLLKDAEARVANMDVAFVAARAESTFTQAGISTEENPTTPLRRRGSAPTPRDTALHQSFQSPTLTPTLALRYADPSIQRAAHDVIRAIQRSIQVTRHAVLDTPLTPEIFGLRLDGAFLFTVIGAGFTGLASALAAITR